MKTRCLVICLLTVLLGCKRSVNEEPEKLPLRQITAFDPGGGYLYYSVSLNYLPGNRLSTYKATQSVAASFKFIYNNEGRLIEIDEGTVGNTITKYTLHYNGTQPEWASTYITNNTRSYDGPDYRYTYTNGNITEVSQYTKGTQTKTGFVKVEYQGQFVKKISSNNPDIATRTYEYFDDAPINMMDKIHFLTPYMSPHLVSMFVAKSETIATAVTTFAPHY